MTRFYRPAVYDRRGPAVQAQDDGMTSAAVYTATVQSLPVDNQCKVVISALSLENYYPAMCKLDVAVGESVLVVFDENKHPWVIA